MADRVRIVVNRNGVRDLLRSPEVHNDLRERAEKIARAAGDGFEADSEVGRNRARASVRTTTRKAREAEATQRALTRAIDAGRG